jgi:fibronectin-binding autotransporter adhesin
MKRKKMKWLTKFLLPPEVIGIAIFVTLLSGSAELLAQDLTNSGSGQITNNSSGVIKVKGIFTKATQTSIGGTVEYNGAGQTVTDVNYSNLTVSGTGATTKTLGGSITISGQISIGANTTFAISDKTLTVSGTTPFTGTGTLSAGTGVVDYAKAGDQAVGAYTYYGLTLSNSGTKTAAGNIGIAASGTLTNNSGLTLDFGSNNLSANNAGVTITNAGTILSAGSVAIPSTAAVGGLFTYNSATSQTIAAATYNNLTVTNGATKTLGGNSTIQGQITLGAVTTLSISDKTLTLSGATPFTGTGLFSTTTGTVDYSRGGDQAVGPYTYYGLTLSGSGVKTAQGNLTITNNGTLTNGSGVTFDMAANDLTADNSGVTITNNGTVEAGKGVTVPVSAVIAGTFIYKGTAAQAIAPAEYNNLTLQAAGAKSFTGTTKVGGTYTVSGGARDYTTGTSLFEFKGGSGNQFLALESYHNLTLSGAAVKKMSAGTASVANALTLGGGTFENSATLTLGTSASAFNSAVTIKSGGSITAGSGNLGFNSDLTNEAGGTLTLGAAKTMHITGVFTNLGTLLFNNTATVTYSGLTAQDIVAATYGNLTLSGSAKTVASGTTTINTLLTDQAGANVLVNSGATLALAAGADANIASNFTNNGTFSGNGAGSVVTRRRSAAAAA